MPSTGRALGPFADVSTERVEGAYEICLGTDDEGRRVEILTLGTTSSKDPSRRRLLADAVNWANSTHTPADAPIVTIELEAEQPYVVALHDERLRGIGRVLDWLLRMGPSTGPLQRITAPVPPHLMRPQAPVSGPVPPPPVSPAMAPTAGTMWRVRRNSAPFIASVVAILALIVFGGGALAVWIAQDPDTSGNAGPSQPHNADDGQPGAQEPTEKETPDTDLPAKLLPDTTASWTRDNDDAAEVFSPHGWPFAWRTDKRMTCEDAEGQATCTFGTTDASRPEAERAEVVVSLERCPGSCDDQTRLELATPTSSRVDYDTWYEKSDPSAPYKLSMIRFFSTEESPEEFYTVRVVGEAVGEDAVEMVERTVNDIYTQAT